MSDQPEIRSRNDILQLPAPIPSLPPTQKLAKDIWGDCVWLMILGLSLLAAKWAVISGEDFAKVLFSVVVIRATLATSKGISLDAVQAYLRR